MGKIKLRIDDDMQSRLSKVADAGGYSSVEEFILHVLDRELDRLDPSDSESEEVIRKKLEGLGYLT